MYPWILIAGSYKQRTKYQGKKFMAYECVSFHGSLKGFSFYAWEIQLRQFHLEFYSSCDDYNWCVKHNVDAASYTIM